MKFDLLLTDIDGTLIDTREFIFKAYQYSLKKHLNLDIAYEQLVPMFGGTARGILRKFTDLGDLEEMFQLLHEFQAKNMHLIVPFPNAIQTLEKLKSQGVKIAGITSRQENAKSVIKTAGLDHLFDLFISGDDVLNHKPHPEGIQKALTVLGVSAEKAIMMGDARDDIEAGKAAGTKTIGVTYGPLGEGIREFDPDFVIDDIVDILKIV